MENKKIPADEENVPNYVVSCNLQEYETERGMVKLERERNGSKGLLHKTNDCDVDVDNDDDNKNNNLRFAGVRTNRPRGLVTHTDQADERFP